MTVRAIINVGDADVTHIGRALRRLDGVLSVIADPVRKQVVVRYVPERVSLHNVRAIAQPRRVTTPALTHLLPWWPRLSRIPSALAAIV